MQRALGKRILLLGLFLALALVAAACGGADDPGAGETDQETEELPLIKFSGLSGGTSSLALKVIEENGFDVENGFRGEYSYQDTDAANQFFYQGRSDVAFDIDVIGVAIARAQGINVTSIGSVVTNHICLMTTKDSPIDSPEDLTGKKVGHYGTDSGGTVTLSILMDELYGIDIFEDWEMVESDPNGIIALLNRGDLDATVAFQPNIARENLEKGSDCMTPYFTEMWNELQGGHLMISTIAAHDDWIEENPDLAEAVLDAWDQGHAWLSENPEALTESPYKELTGVEDPEVLDEFADYVNSIPMYLSTWNEETVAAQEAFIDLAAEQGTLLKENPGGATTILGD